MTSSHTIPVWNYFLLHESSLIKSPFINKTFSESSTENLEPKRMWNQIKITLISVPLSIYT